MNGILYIMCIIGVFASAVILVAAPDRMAVYDYHAHLGLWRVGLRLDEGAGLYYRYTVRAVPCSILCSMERSGYRLNVTLDPEHAARLARLAERTHVQEGTLARSLLSTAIEDADPDARNIVEVLDGIPGAYERAVQSLDRARRGETISLDEL
jgi:hypothetical protein